MKILCAAAGSAWLLMAGSAYAGLLPGNAIYSSYVTNKPDQGGTPNFGLVTGTTGQAGSPLGQEFNISAPTTITGLTFRLSDANPNDGGSILVYLVPDPSSATMLPNNGLSVSSVAGAVELGTILDSTLPTNGVGGCVFGTVSANIGTCNTTISTYAALTAPGDYWIALVNGNDTNNGGSVGSSSGALWWRAGDNIAYDVSGATSLSNSHVNISSVMFSQNTNVFEMQVNTPEPAGMAIIGAGLMGLGFARRRNRKVVG